MVSFALSTLALALTALTTALPTTTTTSTTPQESTLSLVASGYPILPLTAIQSGTLGSLNLIFQRPSVYSGTPFYLNATYVDFDLKDPSLPSPYAMYFPEVGDNYGITVPVTAIYGQAEGRTGFSVNEDGTLAARLDAALENFFACNSTLMNGGEEMEVLQLKWGVFNSNGTSPEGCVAAKLVASEVAEA